MQTTTLPLSGPYAAVAALLARPLPIPPDASPRAVLAAQIEHLIEILDTLDGDSDLEPSLGYYNGQYAYDAESDDYDNELSGDEHEPSLGSLDKQVDQRLWSAGSADDAELDDADDEMDMGNPLGARVDGTGRVNPDGTVFVIEDRVPTRRVRRAHVKGGGSPSPTPGQCALEHERRAARRSAARIGELVASVERHASRDAIVTRDGSAVQP